MVDLPTAASRVAAAGSGWRGLAARLRRVARRAATPLTPAWWATLSLATSLLCLGVGLGWAPDTTQDAMDQTAAIPAAPPAWSTVVRPQPAFTLDLAGLTFEKPQLEVRRHVGGGREDIFTAGRSGGPPGALRVVAYRFGSEVRPASTLYVETVRRAADAGHAVTRARTGSPLATRLGPAEVAEVVVTAADGTLTCLAWRLHRDDVDLRLSGWLCGSGDRPAERAALSCVIDRLELAGSVSEKDLRRAFAEAGRPSCAPARPAAAGRRAA